MTATDPLLFIGLGRMGLPMARRLLDAGLRVRAWDIDAVSRQRWQTAGGTLCESAELDQPEASVIFLCLPTPHGVETLLARWEKQGRLQARCVVDLGTASPSISRHYSSRFEQLHVPYLDVPTSGGTSGAESGSLCVMAGGQSKAFEEVRPLLEQIATVVVYAGDSGSGSRLKALVQYIYLSYNVAFALGTALGEKAGLPAHALNQVLRNGACAHPLINIRLDALETDDSQARFRVWRALKDLSYLEDRDPAGSPATQLLEFMESTLRAAEAQQGMDADIVEALRAST